MQVLVIGGCSRLGKRMWDAARNRAAGGTGRRPGVPPPGGTAGTWRPALPGPDYSAAAASDSPIDSITTEIQLVVRPPATASSSASESSVACVLA